MMKLRQAKMQDLPKIKIMYQMIINKMKQDQIEIWDDIYPCEFFAEDIEKENMYLLEKDDMITAGFVLCENNEGENAVKWKYDHRASGDKVLYLDRLGVDTSCSRQGIGSASLQKAMEEARKKGAKSLRLFVVDYNLPAIALYEKNGFHRAEGIYDEVIDEALTLHEFGYEIEV